LQHYAAVLTLRDATLLYLPLYISVHYIFTTLRSALVMEYGESDGMFCHTVTWRWMCLSGLGACGGGLVCAYLQKVSISEHVSLYLGVAW
jgi:hypothetical protein